MGRVEHARQSPATEGPPTRLPWVLALVSVGLLVGNAIVHFGYSGSEFDAAGLIVLLGFAATSFVGALVASRARGSLIGWLMLASVKGS